jgi:hypothetical protein
MDSGWMLPSKFLMLLPGMFSPKFPRLLGKPLEIAGFTWWPKMSLSA